MGLVSSEFFNIFNPQKLRQSQQTNFYQALFGPSKADVHQQHGLTGVRRPMADLTAFTNWRGPPFQPAALKLQFLKSKRTGAPASPFTKSTFPISLCVLHAVDAWCRSPRKKVPWFTSL